ncbi:MAG: ABC transporter permease [Chloroflexi bacterium]|nr:ABC transporter permease [Chloroflexota bacterium]
MGPLLSLSLRQVAGRRRIAVIVLLSALPVVLSVILHAKFGADREFLDQFPEGVINNLLLGVIMPIVVMTLATPAFGNEIEDRTLNVLVLKPVRRIAIVMPKFLASVVVAGSLLTVTSVAISLIALGSGGGQAAFAVAAAVLTGVLAYSSLFTWMGLVSSKALGFALVYVFLWEVVLSQRIRGIRYFSVREYSLSILHGLDDETFSVFEPRVIEFEAAVTASIIVTVLFFFLTLRRLNRMDIP